MKITSLQELIDRGQTQGATAPGVEYLLQNPNAFIELVKQDMVLALNHAKFFNLEQVEKIAQVNTKLFTALYALTAKPGVKTVSLIKAPLGLNKENIAKFMQEVKDAFEYQYYYDKGWDEDVHCYFYGGKKAFESGKDYNFHSVSKVDYAVCELAYKSHTHIKEVKKTIKEIVSIMLEQLKSSAIKENILDKEFIEEAQTFSNFFTKKYYLIDSMVDNKDYEWLEKVSACMSKATLTQQLDMTQHRIGALSAEVSKKFDELIAADIPSAPPAYDITPKQYLDALTRISELELEVVDLKQQLQAAKLKAENQPSTLNAYSQSINTNLGSSAEYPKLSYQ